MKNRKAWYQICLALLVSLSLIACSDESSSNNDDESSSNESTTRVVTAPNGTEITVQIDPDSNQRTATTENGLTFNATCNGNSSVVQGVNICDI